MAMDNLSKPLFLAVGIALTSCSGGNVYLAPPPSGQGFQLKTDTFDVPKGDEIQNCYFFQIPGTGTDPVYVNKIESIQNSGSHHMNVFRVNTIKGLGPDGGLIQTSKNGVGECYTSSNWSDWPLVFNTQDSTQGLQSWTLPTGVAHKFTPGEWVMLQSHYVNATTQKTAFAGHVEVNLWTTPVASVTDELGTLFATKQSVRICETNPTPKFSGTCQFNSPDPVHIIGANAHFHSRGKQFDMFAWKNGKPGTRFYQSTTWDDPPFTRSPDLDFVVPAGAGVFYTCEYQWEAPPADVGCSGLDALDAAFATAHGLPPELPDCCYTFGGEVEKQEHCNIFVYYYPKVPNSKDINCF